MSVREQLIQLVRDAGYDLLSACEEADRVMKDVQEGGVRRVFHVRGASKAITLSPRVCRESRAPVQEGKEENRDDHAWLPSS